MSNQITITLPDDVYQKAKHFARLANRDLASVLVDTIQFSIPPISLKATNFKSVSALSDQQVLALTELQMESGEDSRLSELLDKQQAGILTESEHSELQTLMQIFFFSPPASPASLLPLPTSTQKFLNQTVLGWHPPEDVF
jgi:hypothetical protein